jgi:hypothetical protein
MNLFLLIAVIRIFSYASFLGVFLRLIACAVAALSPRYLQQNLKTNQYAKANIKSH